MAFKAKDGSLHTNHSTMKNADMRFGAKSAPAAISQADGMGDEDEMMDQPEDGAAMAQQHGPATEVRIHHDHEQGKHSVHTSHPDGHESDTEHASPDEAHKFASDAAGVGGESPADDAGGMGASGY